MTPLDLSPDGLRYAAMRLMTFADESPVRAREMLFALAAEKEAAAADMPSAAAPPLYPSPAFYEDAMRRQCAALARAFDSGRNVYDGNGAVMPSKAGEKIARLIEATLVEPAADAPETDTPEVMVPTADVIADVLRLKVKDPDDLSHRGWNFALDTVAFMLGKGLPV